MVITTFQKKLQNDRNNEDTANAGLKWTNDDDSFLLNKASIGMKISELAKVLKRTEGSIKTRLVINVLNESKETGEDVNVVGSKYGIMEVDIKNYEEKKKIREDKKQKKYPYSQMNTNTFPSDDKAEILEALTQIDKNQSSFLEKLIDLTKIVKKVEESVNELPKKK